MSDLRELYQDLIIDHGRRPRHFGALEGANRTAEGVNPLCGDRLTVYLKLENSRIQDIRFSGAGCAISVASASLMAEQLKGKTKAEANVLFHKFHRLVTVEHSRPNDTEREALDRPLDGALGKLDVLAGVRAFPSRVKCATLAWHALQAALVNRAHPVSTEET
jgi:nitrogen fixation NifU-like protein